MDLIQTDLVVRRMSSEPDARLAKSRGAARPSSGRRRRLGHGVAVPDCAPFDRDRARARRRGQLDSVGREDVIARRCARAAKAERHLHRDRLASIKPTVD